MPELLDDRLLHLIDVGARVRARCTSMISARRL
jgi:hypothetical protein